MKFINEFRLTADHLLLLRHMYVGWSDMEYGAPEIDPKRTYGNTDVEEDIVKILGLARMRDPDGEDRLVPTEASKRQAVQIHHEMGYALQIVLCTQSFRPGLYRIEKLYDSTSWVFVDE